LGSKKVTNAQHEVNLAPWYNSVKD